MSKKKGHAKRIDPFDVNMPELFFDLISERSLFEVLDSLAQACQDRADRFSQDLSREDLHPGIS